MTVIQLFNYSQICWSIVFSLSSVTIFFIFSYFFIYVISSYFPFWQVILFLNMLLSVAPDSPILIFSLFFPLFRQGLAARSPHWPPIYSPPASASRSWDYKCGPQRPEFTLNVYKTDTIALCVPHTNLASMPRSPLSHVSLLHSCPVLTQNAATTMT